MKRRKAKKDIPYGIYCHGVSRTGEYILCPHWKADPVKKIFRCSFCGIEDEEESLLWDQCKECGIREECPKKVLKKAS